MPLFNLFLWMVVFNFIPSVHLIGSCVKKFMQLYSLLPKDYYNHIRPCF